MVQLLRLFCGALIGLVQSSARREAEIFVLRQKINVLRRKSPKGPAAEGCACPVRKFYPAWESRRRLTATKRPSTPMSSMAATLHCVAPPPEMDCARTSHDREAALSTRSDQAVTLR